MNLIYDKNNEEICQIWVPDITDEQFTYSVDTTIPKMWRCGNRKRFIKLLMSYGYGRNDAARIAATIKTSMGPDTYQELFFEATALR